MQSKSHNNTCQSDSLFRGSICAGRNASTKRHPTNCRCTLRVRQKGDCRVSKTSFEELKQFIADLEVSLNNHNAVEL